jgi:HAD superfamily hydrolase (TIGR01509 family)
MYAIVLFDLGDVVAAFDPTPRWAEYARQSGLSPVEVRERLAYNDFWVRTDRGAFSAAEMRREISALLGHQFSGDELLRLQAAAFTVRPELVGIAEAVAEATRVGILTNNAPLLEEAVSVHFPELVRIFDPILFSFQFRHIKPERELYEAVRAFLAVEPHEILFIDDQARHVLAARAAGWHAVQFESVAQIRHALAERGVLKGAA